MKKKGFTLVELLAVLTILSIILVISVPKVIDIIENTRRESFRKGANLIVSTAKTEYSQNLYNTEFGKKVYEFDKNTETGYKSEEELKIRGDKPSTGTVIISEDGKVAIAVVSHDERYCATKTYEEPEVKVTNYVIGKCNIEIDNELIGENIKINITAEPYNEWSKSKEVEITHNAITKSTLQYQLGTTEGEWIDYKDKFIINKNTTIYARLYTKYGSVENQLTVTKIDTTGPTIDKGSVNVTTKSITSQYAVTDEQSGVKNVTCEYGISKEYGSTGTISNSSCVMSNLKNNTKYYYKINAEDNLGNKSSKEYEEVTGDFSTITISPDTSEWSRSKTITVSGETLGSQLQYQLGGTSGTWINISNGGTFNLTSNTTIYARLWDGVNSSKHATLTITTIDRTAPTCESWGGESTTWTNGNRTITVGCSDSQSGCKSSTYTVGTYTSTVQTKDVSKVISDKAGNTATCSKTANIYVDKTAPTCGNFGGQNTTWSTSNRTITIGCSDGQSGCKSSTYTVGTYTSTATTANVSKVISDNVGNTATCNGTVNLYIDKTAPTAPSLSNSSGGNWTNSNVTISASSSDAHSGIAYYQYSHNTVDWYNFANGNYDVWVAERAEPVYVRAVDNAGNVSASSQSGVYIDKTPPTMWMRIDKNPDSNPSAAPVYITSWAQDTASGVKEFKYWQSGVGGWYSDWRNALTYEDGWYVIRDYWTKEGEYTIWIIACDNAGNCTEDSDYTRPSRYINISSSSSNTGSSSSTSKPSTTCKWVEKTNLTVQTCAANGGKLCASGSSSSCKPTSQNTPVCYKYECN